MTEISAETKAYREKAIAHYDEAIASVQARLHDERNLAWLEQLKELRVWAETCEPPVFRPVSELIDEARSKLAADPDDRETRYHLSVYERIKAEFDKQATAN
jgi:hypothetical protein